MSSDLSDLVRVPALAGLHTLPGASDARLSYVAYDQDGMQFEQTATVVAFEAHLAALFRGEVQSAAFEAPSPRKDGGTLMGFVLDLADPEAYEGPTARVRVATGQMLTIWGPLVIVAYDATGRPRPFVASEVALLDAPLAHMLAGRTAADVFPDEPRSPVPPARFALDLLTAGAR